MTQGAIGTWVRTTASTAHRIFASPRNTLVAQIVIAVLLWFIANLQMR